MNYPDTWLSEIPIDLAAQFKFLIEADRLKTVIRNSHIADGSRRENTAEHSWHLSLFAIILSSCSDTDVNCFRVVKMLILHDLVEIDAGDLSIFDEAAAEEQIEREQKAAKRIFGILPEDQGQEMRELWQEFEAAETSDAKFAKAMDRLQPILLNYLNRGGTWIENDVDIQRERRLTNGIERGSVSLWEAAEAIFSEAVDKGWMKSAAK